MERIIAINKGNMEAAQHAVQASFDVGVQLLKMQQEVAQQMWTENLRMLNSVLAQPYNPETFVKIPAALNGNWEHFMELARACAQTATEGQSKCVSLLVEEAQVANRNFVDGLQLIRDLVGAKGGNGGSAERKPRSATR